MEKLLSEMKMENKYNRTIGKEVLDIGMEYTIEGMKCVTTKYGRKLVIIVNFKGELVDLFAPRHFSPEAADLEKNLKKLDKGNFLSLSFILILKFLKSISSVFSIKFSSSIFTFS